MIDLSTLDDDAILCERCQDALVKNPGDECPECMATRENLPDPDEYWNDGYDEAVDEAYDRFRNSPDYHY